MILETANTLRVKKYSKLYQKKNSEKRTANLTLVNRFLNIISRHGQKIKFLKSLNGGINIFYFYFYFLNTGLVSSMKGYGELYGAIPNFVNFFRFSTILKHFTTLLEPMFYIRIKKVEKKYRKAVKKKFQSQLAYIKPNKRTNLVFRTLINYFSVFSHYRYYERIGNALFKALVEHKQSYLYRKKIHMYTKMFKKHKKKVF
jgi:ribosomal protein S7